MREGKGILPELKRLKKKIEFGIQTKTDLLLLEACCKIYQGITNEYINAKELLKNKKLLNKVLRKISKVENLRNHLINLEGAICSIRDVLEIKEKSFLEVKLLILHNYIKILPKQFTKTFENEVLEAIKKLSEYDFDDEFKLLIVNIVKKCVSDKSKINLFIAKLLI